MTREGQQSQLPGDSRFFTRSGPFSLARLLEVTGAEALGPATAETLFEGVAPLHAAGPQHVSFCDNRRYLPLLETTGAGLVVLGPAFVDKVPKGCTALISREPYLLWARVARLFHPAPPVQAKCHPTAVIGQDVKIGKQVEIGPFAVIGDGVSLGDGCVIGAHASVGDHVVIGAGCRIGAHVSLSHALLGERVVLYPGARIGQDGFGFAVGPEGFETVPQLGRVVLGDGVEVGANSTIDRGSMRDTVIGAGTRIDNLVQIGHNAQLGRCCIVVSQAGVSGSTVIEDFVTIAAQAGLIGHIHIGRKARIGAQCGVMNDVDAGADVIGSPAMPFREFFRNVATLRKLSRK
ncbi:UDP-3-O-(3-hydroxymyristoyl)glucosamine N-acyltransferase [Bombella saccharophila]|uniref:UDP-3-O-acylglucosamine N-acyltransferase n=1 Tax=Bombella saccharophila TaxID=2967338 RepID=A0ABT3W5B1_9PROT|nr:UDP-3-O-(3-hydroxymyristoyl)glucosamine N-acyltransferase [Bombella saccharophila]MCX5613893.1 UDP-3-O-(3-hydroxymyristoyl)glucosamine N-acyltransferase [Bombella saccharophila]PHI97378.1 UDP-3-O-(3-hydroxymyristoyl)glucosamine N-acyltransferase [Parasaccharibacter apium]